jgi:putative toxin-antitoxin system antitoxin component (TIGR02293 family)
MFVSQCDLWRLLQQANAVPAEHAANDLDLAKAVEAGFPTAVLDRLVALHVLDPADVSLVVPKTTDQRRKPVRSRLTTEQSDHLVRIVQFTLATARAFGDLDRGKQWLRTASPTFRGLRALDWLRTSVGARVVEQILGRMNHGIGF